MPTVPAEPGAATRALDPLVPIRYLDVVLLVLAAPFVVLLGAPVLGFAVGAVAWILQRFAAVAIERRAARAKDVKTALGLAFAAALLIPRRQREPVVHHGYERLGEPARAGVR